MTTSQESAVVGRKRENFVESVSRRKSPDELSDEGDVSLSIYEHVNVCDGRERPSAEDEEWRARMRTLREWFIRSQRSSRIFVTEAFAKSTTGCFVLETVTYAIRSILSKDVLESLTKEANSCRNGNAAISDEEVQKLVQNYFRWFAELKAARQISTLLNLLRGEDGHFVLTVYNLLTKMLTERQEAHRNPSLESDRSSESVRSAKSVQFARECSGAREVPKNRMSVQSLRTTSGDGRKSTIRELTVKKAEQLARRESELLEYKKLKRISSDDVKFLKKGEPKEVVDYLQILPIHLNRRIMSYIDEKALSGLKKVGKYWGKMIDESINEKSGRRAINSKINKIIGAKPEKRVETDSRSTGEESNSGSVLQLGAEQFLTDRNIKKKVLLREMKKYEKILSKKFEKIKVDTSTFRERYCCLDPKMEVLACSTSTNMVYFYSLRTGARLNFSVYDFESSITCLTLHEDRIHVIVGCKDGTLASRVMRTNHTNARFQGHVQAVLSVHATSTNLLSASVDNFVRCYRFLSGICLFCLDLSQRFNLSRMIAFTEEPTTCAIGTKEGFLVLINIESKTSGKKIKLHNHEIKYLAQGGNTVITATEYGELRVWDRTQLENDTIPPNPYYDINVTGYISCLILFHDQVFVGSDSGSISMFSLADGKLYKTLTVSRRCPILGMAIKEEKFNLKVIIWHEEGIEMRIFSLVNLSRNKRPMKKNNQEGKQKAPQEANKNKSIPVALGGCARNDQEE